MAKIDAEYHKLIHKILQEGYTYEDPNRKGVNRIEIPSYKFRHEFKDGFPAITTKKLHYKNVATELIWFLRGDTNIKYLVDNGCNIWNKDAYNYLKKQTKEGEEIPSDNWFISLIKDGNDKLGDLGKVYGHYWRDYDGFDQIKDIIDKMINTPMSSEIIVTARNPNDKDNQALPCCHYGFQIVMRPNPERIGINNDDHFKNIPKYGFELHWNQRSVDTFLGLPYNIASYATLALILQKITGHKALAIQGDLKKVHLYDNSLDAVKEQLSRDPNKYNSCDLLFNEGFLIDLKTNGLDISLSRCIPEDIKLQNYESYPAINVEMLERDE